MFDGAVRGIKYNRVTLEFDNVETAQRVISLALSLYFQFITPLSLGYPPDKGRFIASFSTGWRAVFFRPDARRLAVQLELLIRAFEES